MRSHGDIRILSTWVAWLGGVLVVAVLAGCGRLNSVAYSKFCAVDVDDWPEQAMCVYRPEVADSLVAPGYYRAYLVVRHRDSYPYSTLRLRMASEALDDEPKERILTVPMADDAGRWLGRHYKSLYERKVLIADSLKVSPGWQLIITPEMNTPALPGINDIGLILIKL